METIIIDVQINFVFFKLKNVVIDREINTMLQDFATFLLLKHHVKE